MFQTTNQEHFADLSQMSRIWTNCTWVLTHWAFAQIPDSQNWFKSTTFSKHWCSTRRFPEKGGYPIIIIHFFHCKSSFGGSSMTLETTIRKTHDFMIASPVWWITTASTSLPSWGVGEHCCEIIADCIWHRIVQSIILMLIVIGLVCDIPLGSTHDSGCKMLFCSQLQSLALCFSLSLYTNKKPRASPWNFHIPQLLQANQELHGAVQLRDVPLHHLRGQHLGASRCAGRYSCVGIAP